MLKALAWPYPVLDNVQCTLQRATYEAATLQITSTSKGWVIAAGQLRDRLGGRITIEARIETGAATVAQAVFGSNETNHISWGIRLLCKESKFRRFMPANGQQSVVVEIPLEKIRGVVEIAPMFLATRNVTSINGLTIQKGAVLGIAAKPIFLTVDEDWTGDTIPVDWLDFSSNNLPPEGFTHIEFSGGSQVPKVWLNLKYRGHLEHVLLRTGDASPAGLAGAAMREFFWVQVWEKVLLWALREESEEHEEWPASRIATHWRSQFQTHGWELPDIEQIDAAALNEMSMRLQHCLLTAQRLSRIHSILRFQPDTTGPL